MKPAIGVHSHLVPFVLADVHGLCDVLEDRQQSLDPHSNKFLSPIIGGATLQTVLCEQALSGGLILRYSA